MFHMYQINCYWEYQLILVYSVMCYSPTPPPPRRRLKCLVDRNVSESEKSCSRTVKPPSSKRYVELTLVLCMYQVNAIRSSNYL